MPNDKLICYLCRNCRAPVVYRVYVFDDENQEIVIIGNDLKITVHFSPPQTLESAFSFIDSCMQKIGLSKEQHGRYET